MKLTPDIWRNMSDEAQAVYAERNDRLWELCRAILGWPASGNLDEVYPLALHKARSLNPSPTEVKP